jgi:hypothetical protein
MEVNNFIIIIQALIATYQSFHTVSDLILQVSDNKKQDLLEYMQLHKIEIDELERETLSVFN